MNGFGAIGIAIFVMACLIYVKVCDAYDAIKDMNEKNKKL